MGHELPQDCTERTRWFVRLLLLLLLPLRSPVRYNVEGGKHQEPPSTKFREPSVQGFQGEQARELTRS